jgi:glycosyltransferase involved in cell wall biosynthesis
LVKISVASNGYTHGSSEESKSAFVKILFANNLRGFYGGVEQVILDYSRGLARRGHTSYLAYGTDARDPEVFALPFERSFQCSEFGVGDGSGLPFERIIEQVKPDVVFFHKVTHLPKGVELDSRFRKVRQVHDHDLWCPNSRGYYRHNRKTCHIQAGWRCYLDLAFIEKKETGNFPLAIVSIQNKIHEMRRNFSFDAVLAVSTYVREQLIKNGFPPERTHLCHPILDQDDPNPSPVPEENRVLFIGSLIRGKGVDFLLRAMQLVKNPFTLDIVGVGKSEKNLRKLTASLRLQDKVNFVGWVDHDHIQDYYRQAKVVAIPSCWPEPFTLVGQESMRHGRPVVAFDVGGNSNWCDNGKSGFVVPEQDVPAYGAAVEKLLSNTTLAREMGAYAAKRVKERFLFDEYLGRVEMALHGRGPFAPNSSIAGSL